MHHGPSNLLWFSDIALIVMVFALWMENRLLASMMAVPDGKNINWVVRSDLLAEVPLPLYLLGMFATLFIVVYLPSHYLCKRFFTRPDLQL